MKRPASQDACYKWNTRGGAIAQTVSFPILNCGMVVKNFLPFNLKAEQVELRDSTYKQDRFND